MATLATGTSGSKSRLRRAIGAGALRRNTTGFTLVEIMIVAFIIGLMAAMAVITFGGSRRDAELDKEAERLDALFDYAREQAELQTRDYGFRTIRSKYQFVVFNVMSNEWRPVEEDDALRERPLPEGLLPSLVIEGRPVVLDSRWPKLDDYKPQILIFANGDLTSFDWSLTREGTNDVAVNQLIAVIAGEGEDAKATAAGAGAAKSEAARAPKQDAGEGGPVKVGEGSAQAQGGAASFETRSSNAPQDEVSQISSPLV